MIIILVELYLFNLYQKYVVKIYNCDFYFVLIVYVVKGKRLIILLSLLCCKEYLIILTLLFITY